MMEAALRREGCGCAAAPACAAAFAEASEAAAEEAAEAEEAAAVQQSLKDWEDLRLEKSSCPCPRQEPEPEPKPELEQAAAPKAAAPQQPAPAPREGEGGAKEEAKGANKYDEALAALSGLGFTDTDACTALLERYNGRLERVINALLDARL